MGQQNPVQKKWMPTYGGVKVRWWWQG